MKLRGAAPKTVLLLALLVIAAEALFLFYTQTQPRPAGLVVAPVVSPAASPAPSPTPTRTVTPTPVFSSLSPTTSVEASVQAPQAPEGEKPLIYGVVVTPYSFGAKIAWSTKPATNASIRWSKIGETEVTEASNELVASIHSFYLTDLKPATTYYFELESCVPGGGCVVKTNAFTTLEELPTASPLVPVPSP